MSVLEGTHGTTRSRAENIKRKGFRKSQGIYGPGIYFWRKFRYAEYLAEGWYKFYLNERSVFREDKDKRFALILVKINLREEEFFDFEDFTVQKRLAELVFSQKIEGDKKKIAQLYRLYLEVVEKEEAVKFKTFQVRVPLPRRSRYFPEYPIQAIGNPYCIVCLEPSRIEILEREGES